MILSVLGMEGFAATEGTVEMPRLVVNISIDQLCSEDLQAFMPRYSEDGLKKLLSQGKVYTNVTYPFAPIDRASATATLQTGTTPRYHGIIGTEWIEKSTLRPTKCTRVGGAEHPSAKALLSSTVGDEIKLSTYGGAIVYAVAAEEDGAILSAGHNADGAIWFDRTKNKWVAYNHQGEQTPTWMDSWNNVRKKQLKTLSKTEDALTNTDITDIALQCQSVNRMGYDTTVDYLSLQYYVNGTAESYYSLDNAVDKLITTLEHRIGKENLLFIVTSTGYRDDKGIELEYNHVPSGTFYINRTAGYLNMYLAAIYGTGTYVEAYHENQIYLNHNELERKRIRLTEALDHCREMLLMSEGVQEAYTAPWLTTNSDDYSKTLREGYHRKVSGDVIVEVAPGWKVLNEDTRTYQQQHQTGIAFPVIFYGGNIEAETINTAVTATQIAPTISKSIRIRAPNACKSTPLF